MAVVFYLRIPKACRWLFRSWFLSFSRALLSPDRYIVSFILRILKGCIDLRTSRLFLSTFLLVFCFSPLKSYSQDKSPKAGLSPKYESCKGTDLSQLEDPSSKTEADFCIGCAFNKVKNFLGITDIQKSLSPKDIEHAGEFRQTLQKRVIGQISARIFQMKKLKACVDFDGRWFPGWNTLKAEDKTALKQQCQEQTSELKSAVKSRWSDMRVHLSLSAPRLREDRVIADRKTWFNSTPSHGMSEFASSLTPLTKAEKKAAEEKYIEALAEAGAKLNISIEVMTRAGAKLNMSPEVLRHRLSNKLPLELSGQDMRRLKWEEQKFRKESRKKYLQKVGELPILAYLNKSPPTGKELAKAIDKMETQLQTMLEKVEAKDVDLGLLLSFNPLVEELLKEDKRYCLVAEAGRIEAEGDDRFENYALLGASLLSAVPCFAGGVVGRLFCFGGESLVGVKGYELAKEGMEASLGRVLTGKDYEKISNLEGRQRELFLEKLFLPLAVWGGAGPLLRSVKRTMTGPKPTAGTDTKPVAMLSQTKAQKYAKSLPAHERKDYVSARQIEAWAQGGHKPFKDKGIHFVERTFKNPNQADHKFSGSPRTIIHKTAPSAENLRLRRKYNPRIEAFISSDNKVYILRKWQNHSGLGENMPPEFSVIDVDMEEVFKNIPESMREKFSPKVTVYINESGEIVVEKRFNRTYNTNAKGDKTLSEFWHDEEAGFKLAQKKVKTKEFKEGEELRTALPGNQLTTEDMVKRARDQERNMPLDIALNSGESMSVKISDVHQIPPDKISQIKATWDSQNLNFIFGELNAKQTAKVTPEQMKFIESHYIRPDQAKILREVQVRGLREYNIESFQDPAVITALMDKFSPKQISEISPYSLQNVPDWPSRLKNRDYVNAVTRGQLERSSDDTLRDFYSLHFFKMEDRVMQELRSLRPESFWKDVKVRATIRYQDGDWTKPAVVVE